MAGCVALARLAPGKARVLISPGNVWRLLLNVDPLTDMIQRIGDRLLSGRLTLATAESCSGGLIGHLITNAPGASEWFMGGIIAYSNEVKKDVLGVPADELAHHGAVSAPVARHMAEGALRRLKADYAVGVTGIAGPGGGTPEKPVGLVFIAVADKKGTDVRRHEFSGSREEVKQQTAERALAMIWERIA